MIDLSTVTLAILAGGAGSRMGLPKSHLTLEGKPILMWLLEKVRWPGPTMVVTSPDYKDPPGWQTFDLQAVDPMSQVGPLRGILTALEMSQTPITVVTTVDMPMVRMDILSFLVDQLQTDASLTSVMCEIYSSHGRQIEPFPSVFRATAIPMIQQHLACGKRSVHSLCHDPACVTVHPPAHFSTDIWTNLNDQSDLATFIQSLDTFGD